MPVTIRINPAELNRLKLDLDAADKKLTTALRKRIKAAGQIAVDAIRDSLDNPPDRGGPDPEGFREALQRMTSTRVSFSAKSAGVKIATSSSGLPLGDKSLMAAYNSRKGLRHPLFGDTTRWFQQKGRPYFGAAIFSVMDKGIQPQILAALDEAVDALGGRIR